MHDVFISYPAEAKSTADAACAALENANIRCWIAPRDVRPGSDWSESIVDAIQKSRLMVLIFDKNANESQHIKREVERAVDANIPIIPMRIEDIAPNKGLSYFISSPHWLDALSPPLEKHLQHLVETTRHILGAPAPAATASPALSYETPRPAFRAMRWTPLVLGATLAFALVAGGIALMTGLRRSAAVKVAQSAVQQSQQAEQAAIQARSAAGAPAAPVAAPADSSQADLQFHIQKLIESLLALDKQLELVKGGGAKFDSFNGPVQSLGYADASLFNAFELAGRMTSLPVIPYYSAGVHGDRDGLFKKFGVSDATIDSFRAAASNAQYAATELSEAGLALADLKRLDEIQQSLPNGVNFPTFAESGDMRMAGQARKFIAESEALHLSAIRVLRELRQHIGSAADELTSTHLLWPTHPLQATGEQLGHLQQKIEGLRTEAQETIDQSNAARDEVTRQRIEALTAGLPEELRPVNGDTDVEAIEKARKLRQAGRIDDALAAFVAVGLLLTPTDRNADSYAAAAIDFTRQAKSLGAAGGLYVSHISSQDTSTTGITDGAIVLAYNGKRVTTQQELLDAIASAPAEMMVRVDIAARQDNGKFQKHTITRSANTPLDAALLPI